MTVVAARSAGPSWLRRHDPELFALRRAVRVTVASGLGFYACLYAFDDSSTALYALFGAIALGALSDVFGTPAQRTRTYLAALVVGLALVTLGTMLAVTTWTAVVGMLVVGFLVSFSGVGGPRVAGIANGLQLFYVLPCFPPYAPDQLDERLIGLTIGIVLMAVADRFLLPAPAPPAFVLRLGAAATAAARYAEAVAGALADPTVQFGAGSGDKARAELRAAARAAADGLRMSKLPVAERPAGPGRRHRSLTVAAIAVRVVVDRLGSYEELLADPELNVRDPAGAVVEAARLVEAIAAALAGAGAALAGREPAPDTAPLDDALVRYSDRRREQLVAGHAIPARLLAGLAAVSVAVSARRLVLVTAGVVGAPSPPVLDHDLWFLNAPTAGLWWRRCTAHLTPRSVYLQNAVRLAAGLAVARVVAGVFDLSHGFWVLLATLSLMRTSAVASRPVLVRAFAGTLAGALVAALLLTIVGGDTVVYAIITPPLMVVAFAIGPVFGVAAGQAGFTVVISMIFAQLAASNWHLAETRLADVLIGGLVGAVIGVAVWPRGGGGEIRRAAARNLDGAADEIVATTGYITGEGGPAQPSAELVRLVALFDQTYTQYRLEPTDTGPQPDWLTVVGVVHRVVRDATILRERYPDRGPLPWAQIEAHVRASAADVAGGFRALARGEAPGPTERAAAHRQALLAADRLVGDFAAAPDDTLRAFDTWGWVLELADDLRRAQRAIAAGQPEREPGV
jgi:uncharacterized membrane protein YccC